MTRPALRRQSRQTVAVLLLSLALAACGSQLDPKDVAGTTGSVQAGTTTNGGTGPDGSVPGDTGLPGTTGGDDGDTGDLGGTGDIPGDTGGDPGAPGQPAAPGESTDPDGSNTGDNTSGNTGDNSATGDGPAGSCDGFKNQTGITDSAITLANASDISGPVPGLFQAAQNGTKAFIAYYNATTKLCGRTLKLETLDSRADAAADQQAYTKACTSAFAVVGSVSSADAGGAATAEKCGIPDIRAFNVTPDRQGCGTCFSTYTTRTGTIAASHPKYWVQKEPSASQHVGIFYVDVAASKVNAQSFASGFEKGGMNVDVLQGIGTAEFNYAPFVQQMKDKKLDFIVYFGPYQFATRLQKAMEQQRFKPSVYLEDPTIYDADYVTSTGAAANGSYVYSVIELLDNTKIPEMALYRAWLEQVAPGSTPNYYGLFAWSAARLFVEQATSLGGKLDRKSLVSALSKVKNWTGNGLHAPMAIGARTTSPCIKIIQLNGGTWKQVSSGDFMCGGLITS